MAICTQCGKEIRDDVWTCGVCGTPVAQPTTGGSAGDSAGAEDGAYGSEGYNPYAAQAAADQGAGAYGATLTSYENAPEGMTPYGTPIPQTRPASDGGLSSLTKLVLAGAGVAVLAIVLVWFFALRGGDAGGTQFLGDWQALDTDMGSIVIAKNDGDFEITLVSGQGGEAGPFKGDLQGDELELKFEAADEDDTNEAVAKLLKAFVTGALEDAHLMLSVRGADGHLLMSISGKAANGGDDVKAQAAEYVKRAIGV